MFGAGLLYASNGIETVLNFRGYHNGGPCLALTGPSGDSKVDGGECTEWFSTDPEFPDQTQQHGVGILCEHADNMVSNFIVRWTRVGIQQTSNAESTPNTCKTTSWNNIHIYNGAVGITSGIASGSYNSGTGIVSLTLSSSLPLASGFTLNLSGVTGTGADLGLVSGTQTATSGTGGTTVNFSVGAGHTISTITAATVADVFLNPTNVEIDADSGGSALYRGFYEDDGTIEDSSPYQSLNGIFPLQASQDSVFTPCTFARIYAQGTATPFGLQMTTVPTQSYNGCSFVQLLDNPNSLTATAATDGAGHVVYTLTGGTTATASIAGPVMTVTGGSGLLVGGLLSGSGVIANTRIVAQLTGSAGGIGTYQIMPSQTTGSTTVTQASWLLNSPQPVATNGGYIHATNCTTSGHNGVFPIFSGTATTPTTVAVTNATGGTSTGCTIALAWAGDATIINGIVANTAQVYRAAPEIVIGLQPAGNAVPDVDIATLNRATWTTRVNNANGGYCLEKWNTSVSGIFYGCGATGTTGAELGPSADADSAALLGDPAHRWYNVTSQNYSTGSKLWVSNTPPSVTSGLGTSPTVAATCSTASCRITVGASGSPSSTVVIGMPTASNDWACTLTDATSNVTFRQTNTANASSVTFTGSGAPSNSDLLRMQCGGN